MCILVFVLIKPVHISGKLPISSALNGKIIHILFQIGTWFRYFIFPYIGVCVSLNIFCFVHFFFFFTSLFGYSELQLIVSYTWFVLSPYWLKNYIIVLFTWWRDCSWSTEVFLRKKETSPLSFALFLSIYVFSPSSSL